LTPEQPQSALVSPRRAADETIEMPTILRTNHERLMESFNRLAAIGAQEDGSIDRRAFNEADMEARRWLMDEARGRGLMGSMDSAANVTVGVNGSAARSAVVIGSHLDSVPFGGAFDGALGVIIGLEVVTTLHEQGLLDDHPVEAVAFSDEEGRFGGMLGSRALAGLLSPEDIAKAVDLNGVTLREAMASHGLDAADALHARRRPESIRAFLEVHVEQGRVLDESRERVGLVTDIAGLFKWVVTLRGEADHAGTTPMGMRRDAFQGLAEFASEIARLLEEHGSDVSMATIGSVGLRPGAANSVPGEAVFSLDVRDTDGSVLEELGPAARRTLSTIARRRGLMFEFEEIERIPPTACDARVVRAVEEASTRVGVQPRRLHSGAAHDAQMMASVAPMGMIFTPSVGGRSHSPAEWTHREDIELAADVALNAVLDLSAADAISDSTKMKEPG